MDEIKEVKAVFAVLTEAMLNIIQEDPHQWSERPCQSCKTISAMIGRPFGCYLYAKQRAEQREKK
jgi:hypothetical protein